jgi:uncharacterized membrane protein YeaQ/YmgE (transglycosylase-associated protein family)
MSIIGWIVLGLIAGFIASKIVNKSGEGLVLDIVLGIIGAFVGGFLFNLVGEAGVTGFNIPCGNRIRDDFAPVQAYADAAPADGARTSQCRHDGRRIGRGRAADQLACLVGSCNAAEGGEASPASLSRRRRVAARDANGAAPIRQGRQRHIGEVIAAASP